MSIAMTSVLPDPVAILAQSRANGPPSPGTSMPCRSPADASVSQISVSTASSWQKKNRRSCQFSGSRQCWRSRWVVPVAPGYPASRHAFTRGRMRLTSGSSTNTPGSSKDLEPGVATT
jgi:hypothetical protein